MMQEQTLEGAPVESAAYHAGAAFRMEGLVKQLLTLSKIEAARRWR
ncbi:hypothetical protein ACVXG7_00100 [Enterobacter hormaechei]